VDSGVVAVGACAAAATCRAEYSRRIV